LDGLAETVTIAEDVLVETSLASCTCADTSDDVEAEIASVQPRETPDPEFFFLRQTAGTGNSKSLYT